MSPEKAAVLFEHLTVELGGTLILDDICAQVPLGGSTAIVGPNGAGKTTLLLALLKQISYRGAIQVNSMEGRRPPRMGYVPQRLQFDRGLPLTVLEFLAMGWQRSPLCFGIQKKHRDRAMGLLGDVKAEGLEKRRMGALSGGELQRVLLALAIGQEPDLLILDEPAAGVDVRGGQVFCELLEHLRRERNFTQLMVSHDLAMVTYHATHVICLNRRLLAQGPPRKVLTQSNLQAVFGVHMGLVNALALPSRPKENITPCCKGGKGHA